MTTFLTTILVLFVVVFVFALTWLAWLRLTRLTIELICESIHNLSQAIFASKQMAADLSYRRSKDRLQLRAAARAARAKMWSGSDIEIELLSNEVKR